MVGQLGDLFRTTHAAKTQQVVRSRGHHCGDVELVGYLENTGVPMSLVFFLLPVMYLNLQILAGSGGMICSLVETCLFGDTGSNGKMVKWDFSLIKVVVRWVYSMGLVCLV